MTLSLLLENTRPGTRGGSHRLTTSVWQPHCIICAAGTSIKAIVSNALSHLRGHSKPGLPPSKPVQTSFDHATQDLALCACCCTVPAAFGHIFCLWSKAQKPEEARERFLPKTGSSFYMLTFSCFCIAEERLTAFLVLNLTIRWISMLCIGVQTARWRRQT